jgi:hypothetical protein
MAIDNTDAFGRKKLRLWCSHYTWYIDISMAFDYTLRAFVCGPFWWRFNAVFFF